MVNRAKASLKRADTAHKKFIRRQYNRVYYETTKEQRREHYQNTKKSSESRTDFASTFLKTKQSTATTTTTPNNYDQFYGINDDIDLDKEDFEGTYSVKYNYKDDHQAKDDYQEPGVFCYDTDNSSTDESHDALSDDEHSNQNLDNIFDETKLKFSSREYSKTDIATCLCLLKKRHRCSNALLTDIISLLHIVVPDAEEKIPKSIFEIRKLLKIINDNKQSTLSTPKPFLSSTITICQLCDTIAQSTDKCSNIECPERGGFKLKPYIYTYFNLRRQIEQILQRERKINFHKTSSLSISPSSSTHLSSPTLTDIKDGEIYQNFLSKMSVPDCYYITLTLSTDGVQIGTSTEKSLWITTLTINEIQLSERFLLHNVIIGGINSCFKKPSREITKLMINPIVQELKELQTPKCCYIKSLNNQFEMYCTYLLGSTNDKPATALLQNIAEPTGAYGCSRCEIKGITTLSNPLISEKKTTASTTTSNIKKTCKETHRIRVFVTEKDQPKPELRSTERYQTVMRLIERKKPTPGTDEEQDMRRGYLGPCLLADLSFFDQGRSFMSDSLHTLYGGGMKKLLALWFDRKWRTKEKPWTIESKIPSINLILNSFYSPSTTVRIPRDLKLYHKYKASEYRSMLLVFYPIFQNVLPKNYYDHLKLLVFAIHIGENRKIEKQDLKIMDLLLTEHVQQFKILYGERHCVNTIHSIIHFADAVRDYGPLQCFSTFNYESILAFRIFKGAITSTIHGCRQQDKEIFNNMEMLRQSSYMALEESQESVLYEYMLKLIGKRYRKPFLSGQFTVTKSIQLEHDEKNYLQEAYSTKEVQAYYRCEYENIQYASYHWKQSKLDAAILFHNNNTGQLKFGIIDKFIVCNQSEKQLFIELFELEDEYCDYLTINGNIVKNSNTAIGRINFTSTTKILPTQIIEKVFCIHRKEQFMFIRLPNTSESS